MQYVVAGVDAPSFGSVDDVDDAHQDYMDRWADVLIARGPTLSADGEEHTGSVHVIELTDLAAARRFAREEPYARSGWYSAVTVSMIVPCLDGTMWDRPAPTGSEMAALVTSSIAAQHPASSLAATLRPGVADPADGWIYVGVMCDEAGNATGVLALIDDRPVDAQQKVATLLNRAGVGSTHLETSRWWRGGRSAA